MNKWMLSAAMLLFLTTAVHVFMGGPEIHVVIQESELRPDVRAVGAVIWHAITAILFAFGLACLWMARQDNPAMALLVAGTQVSFAALFVFYGLTLLGNLWVMPQWIIFLLVPAVIGCGMRRKQATVVAAE